MLYLPSRTLEHWKGILSIIIAVATPFGAWGMGETSLRAAIVLGVIAGLTALYSWVDDSLAAAKSQRLLAEAKSQNKRPEVL